MIAAVILSAGESSRMGSPKALLPVEGKSFIERIVAGLKESRVGEILVVLGHHAAEIEPQIRNLPITVIINRDYRKGQLSSLMAAINYLTKEREEGSGHGIEAIDGILVHLVDHPFLSPQLVNEMLDRFYETKRLIVVPSYRGKRGHPVLFSRELFSELLNAPLDQGAKPVVHGHRNETLEIPTEENGVIVDIDTPDEYRAHLGKGLSKDQGKS